MSPLPPSLSETAKQIMPTKFAKGDEVRVHAKKFDEDGETDALGLKWSERWLRDGHVSPPTCFCCSFHDIAVCRKYNCWERHLAEVRRNMQEGLEI
jgi:hypothetical protein